jgi:replicative DNA helicase
MPSDDQLTKELRHRLAEYLYAEHGIRIDDPGKSSRKPFKCLNPGHTDENPSMYYFIGKDGIPRLKCQSCGVNYGIFDLVYAYHRDCDTLTKQKAEVQRALSLPVSPVTIPTRTATQKRTDQITSSLQGLFPGADQSPMPDHTDQYREWHQAVIQTTFFTDRKLTPETIERFNLGYVHHPDPHECLAIFPCTPSYYVARRINPKTKKDRYKNVKGSTMTLFNEGELDQTEDPVFIAEGVIDALSIIQMGFRCVGMNSLGNKYRLMSAIRKRDKLPPLILMLDNDQDGVTITEEIKQEFQASNHSLIEAIYPKQYKDPNFMFECDPDMFLGVLEHSASIMGKPVPEHTNLETEIMEKSTTNNNTPTNLVGDQETPEQEKVREREDEVRSFSFDSCFQAFANHSQPDHFFPTGLGELDKHLDGGLYEGLTILGAQNTIGKSSLALQIASNVVLSGDMVIYFSTEQSPRELVTKLISMHTEMTFRQVRDIVSPAPRGGITKEMEERFGQFMLLADRFSERLFFVYGRDYRTVSAIRETTQNIVNLVGMDKPPLIIVDYLQMLQPPPLLNRATEKQVTDYNVLELKDISSHFSTAVLGISSLNRSSYGYDISDSAFKESGAIEYGCDCLMGLQFSVLEKMDEDGEYEKGEKVKKLSTKQYEDEKKRPLRYLQVKVMKQRNGVCGVRAYLNFETAYSKFIPTTREEQGKMMNRKERELFG